LASLCDNLHHQGTPWNMLWISYLLSTERSNHVKVLLLEILWP